MAEAKESDKRSKRRVRNSETFRERALKATAESGKPKREKRLRRLPGQALRPVGSPIAKGARRLASVQPFKAIFWFFRLLGRIILPKYLRTSWKELRQVAWPSWKESRRLTFAVLLFAIIFGGAVALVDYGLDKVFKQILLK